MTSFTSRERETLFRRISTDADIKPTQTPITAEDTWNPSLNALCSLRTVDHGSSKSRGCVCTTSYSGEQTCWSLFSLSGQDLNVDLSKRVDAGKVLRNFCRTENNWTVLDPTVN